MNPRLPSAAILGGWLIRACFPILACGACLAAALPDSRAQQDLPPLPKSPVGAFRQWLDLSSQDRIRALEGKPEPVRRILLSKLAEYDAMDAVERDQRLRATELQFYLRPLLRAPVADRPRLLAAVPLELRPSVVEHLSQWDALDADTRQALIVKGWAIRYFVRLEANTDTDPSALRDQVPFPHRIQFETELARWKALPPSQRRDLVQAFREFFELPPPKQQQALNTLPESERRQIEATLHSFAQLAPAQRHLCVESFRKFASLSPAQRASFLRNADLWKEMSPDDRATWRRLVTQFPPLPPLPPAHFSPPMPGSNQAPVLPPKPPLP